MTKEKILIFILSVFIIFGITVAFFPDNGIKITDNFILYFPNYKDILNISSDSTKNEIATSIINTEIIEDIDSLNLNNLKNKIQRIEFPKKDTLVLANFFTKLKNISKYGTVRIMHYGDSQIEGDRMTADIRNRLQEKFGGNGIGLVSPITIYAQWSLNQEWSDNWLRFTGYGYIDTLIKHRKYGPMITLCRFSPVNNNEIFVRPENIYSASLHLYKSNIGYGNSSNFRKIVVYYGNAKEKTKITLSSEGNILATDSLQVGEDLYTYSYISNSYLSDIRLDFESYDSPDFYGISLEDTYGITVDNIGLRGSSGDVFSNQNATILSQSYANLGVDLFILQFGGNAIVNVSDDKSIDQFISYFKYHVNFLKSLNPNSEFILIGPSDMSIKVKNNYESYPHIEKFIKKLKKMSFECNIAYWDSYKAMGGKNSMPLWVKATPPLAEEDYVHFSPKGANIMSHLFYNALMFEYLK
ncbi:MAG: hypothetical protein LBV69_11395 [Bacteroidales bacterium]|jgi:lysophospholipase L1-like esterase|nr:hypothetical protein [Bacteroidales bacterium]